jgi:peptide/nickel transport system substrate-binding protein
VAGSKISYKRNESYWGDKLPFDKVEFQILTDETARLNALKSGQIDGAVLARAATATEAEAAGLSHKPYATNWEGIFFFDRDGVKVPELKDARVRKALTLAIDREALLQAVSLGKGKLTSQTFRSDTKAFDSGLEDAYKYDPERAKQLLKEAGAENLALTLPVSPVFDPAIYDSIEANWKAIGVKVTRHQWGPGQAIPSMLRGEFPVAYMSLVQRDDWRHIQLLIGPNAPYNSLKTQRPELNALIQKMQTGDEKTFSEAAKQLNKYLVDENWFAPLYRLEQHFYYNDKVTVENQAEQAVPSIYNYKPTGK